MQPVSIVLTAAAVAAGLLATGPVASASSQTDLADWLSRAEVHIEAIHKAESDAYATTSDRQPVRTLQSPQCHHF